MLECGVCEDVFSLQGDKVPRLLLCGHTVCHDCLTRLPLHGRAIRCPFDRQVTDLGRKKYVFTALKYCIYFVFITCIRPRSLVLRNGRGYEITPGIARPCGVDPTILFSALFVLFGHTCWSSELTPGSILSSYPWWTRGTIWDAWD